MTLNPNEQRNGSVAPMPPEPWADLGHPAEYRFGRWPESVRLLSVTSDGAAIVLFGDGRLDAVELHRVRMLS